MKTRIAIIIVAILAVQAVLWFALRGRWGGAETVQRTPIPTLIPATAVAAPVLYQQTNVIQGDCPIAALDLIGAWVTAGKPETDPFEFQGMDGSTCQGTFEDDIHPLFTVPNLWFTGAIACSSCHGPEVNQSAAQMDLSTYAGVLAGSRRESPDDPKGEDILGSDTSWEESKLYIQIFTRQMPMGRPIDSPQKGPTVHAGTLVQ
ncbi:MAG: hypothetical protein GYA17_00910 [Chloroflexi bacterium]|nr:hypothetical protein [Chloroflexota bacterium]